MANLSAFGGAQPITPGGLVELGYKAFTTAGSITAVVGSPVSLLSPLTVVCDGGPIIVECYLAGIRPDTSLANRQIFIALYEDGVQINAQWGLYITPSAGDVHRPGLLQLRRSPSAGSHTYEVRAYVDAGTGYISSDIGGRPESFLRVSKIVQQNDGLKPFWTPPLVTQLPTNPTVGDTVMYAADATNGVYWNLYYDGIGSYPWKYVGGPSLKYWTSTNTITSSGSFVSDANFAGFTIPLAGDYEVTTTCLGNNTVAYGWFLFRPNGCGYDTSDYRAARTSAGVAGAYETASHFDRVTLTTGTLGGALRQAAGGSVTLATRSVKATPVRVAA